MGRDNSQCFLCWLPGPPAGWNWVAPSVVCCGGALLDNTSSMDSFPVSLLHLPPDVSWGRLPDRSPALSFLSQLCFWGSPNEDSKSSWDLPPHHLEPVAREAQLSLPVVSEPQDRDCEASWRSDWPEFARPCPGPAVFISTSGAPGSRTHVCGQLQRRDLAPDLD